MHPTEPNLASSFLSRSRDELQALLAQKDAPDFDATDAYRLLVLLGRMAQNADEDGGPDHAEIATDGISEERRRALAADLRTRCELPGEDQLLANLGRELADDASPVAGALHDAILDVDDLATISALLGADEPSDRLCRMATRLIHASSRRTASLARWARMRMLTCRSQSALSALWGAIVSEASQWQPVGLRRIALALRYEPVQALAAEDQSTGLLIEELEAEFPARLYLDQATRELMIDLELPSNAPVGACRPVFLVIHRTATGEEQILFRAALRHEQDGRDLYLSLGPQHGPESLLRRALDTISAAVDVSTVRLTIRFEDAD